MSINMKLSCQGGHVQEQGLLRYVDESRLHVQLTARLSLDSRIKQNHVCRLQVGKGLLKDEKAQKLALQHWLEAVRPCCYLIFNVY